MRDDLFNTNIINQQKVDYENNDTKSHTDIIGMLDAYSCFGL